jgi:hypothetical protein
MQPANNWVRYPRTSTAIRTGENGMTITRQTAHWAVIQKETNQVTHIDSECSLEEAICIADNTWPPSGWTMNAEGNWERPGWLCACEDDHWFVYRTGILGATADAPGVLASTKSFVTPDRARQWVEIRLDRTALNLRGPRPRAGEKASVTLPDVRVTGAERELAVQLAADLGISYSDLMRAALGFVAKESKAGGQLTLANTGRGVAFLLTPREIIAQ